MQQRDHERNDNGRVAVRLASFIAVQLSTVLIVLYAVASIGCAQDNIPFEPQMKPLVAHTSWIGRDGAPGDVSALAQTTDGYLWLGTPLGLYRFDGLQFSSYPVTPLDTKLPSMDIDSLSSDAEGGLWIGFRIGGIVIFQAME